MNILKITKESKAALRKLLTDCFDLWYQEASSNNYRLFRNLNEFQLNFFRSFPKGSNDLWTMCYYS